MERFRNMKNHPVKKAALFHLEFEYIHPLPTATGNGAAYDKLYADTKRVPPID